jgi:hypothetical protein
MFSNEKFSTPLFKSAFVGANGRLSGSSPKKCFLEFFLFLDYLHFNLALCTHIPREPD